MALEVAVDRAVLTIAGRGHGVVTTAQLTSAGLSKDAIASRVARGWLRRLHRGVYLVGPLEAPSTRAMAAVAACGHGALLSHASAGALWGICAPPPLVHVTVVGRPVHGRPELCVHRARLDPRDATRHQALPATSPARTLLDLAAMLGLRELERAVEEAQVHRLASVPLLNEQLGRYPHHRGTAALRRAIRSDPKLTRSEAERRTLELIRAARLPEPETNAHVAGYEVDLLWRPQRLILEVDGYAFHSTRRSFERDRRRDRELQAAGYRVMRVTWRDISDEPHALVATLAAALAA